MFQGPNTVTRIIEPAEKVCSLCERPKTKAAVVSFSVNSLMVTGNQKLPELCDTCAARLYFMLHEAVQKCGIEVHRELDLTEEKFIPTQ